MSGANGNVLGWVIEWRNSFRFYSGVVVEVDTKNSQSITVYDYVENEEYAVNLKTEHIKMLKPFLQQFIKYKRKYFLLRNERADEEAIHQYVLTQLERIGEDNKVMGIEKRIEIKRESLGLQKIKSSKARDNKSTSDDAGTDEIGGAVHDTNDEEDEEEDEGSDPDDDNDEEDEEEDDDEEDDEIGESDEEESSEEESEEEESSEEEEETEGQKVDIKVHILPYQDIRGFSVFINSEGLAKILRSIKKDYKRHHNAIKGTQPKLFYRDPEGDIINIMTSQDLKYAYRTARGSVSARSGSIPLVLKLFAELDTKPSPTSLAAAPKLSQSGKSVASATATSSNSGISPRGSGGPLELLTTNLDSRNAVTQRRLKIANSPGRIAAATSSYYQAHTTFDNDNDDEGESEFKRFSGQETYDLESLQGSPERSPSDRLSNNLSVTNTHSSNNGSLTGGSSPKKPTKAPYEVIWKKGEILGSGSFGEVYSGINLVNGDRIAVKEVSFQSISNAKGKQNKNHMQQIKALQHEVKVLSSLDHPNIIKYLGTERTKYTLRIFLELATEGTVRDIINEFGPFPESLLRRYTIDIIEGLHFLHCKKFMHRDIKPTNLLISHGVVKLGDFGCSTATRDDDLTGSNAGHGTIIGTAVYMAPEVMRIEDSVFGESAEEADSPPARGGRRRGEPAGAEEKSQAKGEAPTHRRGSKDNDGYYTAIAETPSPHSPGAAEPKAGGGAASKKGYNKKADIWSLGITLCEMANGKSTFKNAAAAIYCVCVSKKYPTLPSHYSVDAHRFIDRCLVENPKQRANSTELRSHPFLTQIQSLDEIRAQTAAVTGMNNKTSTVKLDLPHDASFFNSQQFHTCTDGGGGLLGGSGPQGDRLRLATTAEVLGEEKGTADSDDVTFLRADQKKKVSPSGRLTLTADSKSSPEDREIRTRSGNRGARLASTSGTVARARPSRYDDSEDEEDTAVAGGDARGGGGGRESPHYSSASDDSLFSTTVGHALHGPPSLMNSSNFHTVYARQLTSTSPSKPAVRPTATSSSSGVVNSSPSMSSAKTVSRESGAPRSDFNSTFGAAITPAKNNIGTFPLTSTDISIDAGSSGDGNGSDRWAKWNNKGTTVEDEDTMNSTVSHLFQR